MIFFCKFIAESLESASEMRAKSVESKPPPKPRNGLSKTAGGKIAKPKKVALLASSAKKSKPAPSSGGAKKHPPEPKPNPKKSKPKDDTPKEDKSNVVKPKANKIVRDLVKKPVIDGKIGSGKVKPSARTKKVVISAKDDKVATIESVVSDEKIVVDEEVVKKKSPVRSKEKVNKNKIPTPKKKIIKLKTVSKVLGDKSKKIEAKSQPDVKNPADVELNGLETEPIISSPEPEKTNKNGKAKTKDFKKVANGGCLPLTKKSGPKQLAPKVAKKAPPKLKPVKTSLKGVKNVIKPKKERKKKEARVYSYNNDSSTSDDLPLDALVARQKNGLVLKSEPLETELINSISKVESDAPKKEPLKKVKQKESEKSKDKSEPAVIKKETEVKKESDSKKEPEVKSKKVKTEVKDEAPVKKETKKKATKVKANDSKKGNTKPESDAESAEDSKVAQPDFCPNLLKSMKKEFCEPEPVKKSKLQKTKKNLKTVVKKLKPKALKKSLVSKQKALKKKLSKPKTKAPADDESDKAVAKRTKALALNGARRHRVASLNAIAKVHCLYENESRGALTELHDDLLQITEEGRDPERVFKKMTQVSKRILRSAPGIRSVGQHWDMNGSSSDSGSSEEDDKSESEKSEEEDEPPKPVKKRRRQAECKMDLKDMVVRKRMASLNASAILAASYSVEKRTSTSTVSVREATASKRKGTSSAVAVKEATPAKRKVEVIVTQDTDVTITGVYVDSTTRSARSEYSMKYRISSTSHTQTEAVSTETLIHAEVSTTQSTYSFSESAV